MNDTKLEQHALCYIINRTLFCVTYIYIYKQSEK